MADSEKDIFSFTWHIENFSMCPQRYHDYIQSPPFVAIGTKWALQFCPRADMDKNYVSCFLKRIISEEEEEAITIRYELIAHSVYSEKEIRFNDASQSFDDEFGWGKRKFCLREDILNRVNGFLLNDTLTLECRIWGRIEREKNITELSAPAPEDLILAFSDSSLQSEMRTTAARNEVLGSKIQLASSQYLARTVVRIGRKCILWPIGRFHTLRPDQRLSIPVVATSTNAPEIAMTLYLNEKSDDGQSVQIEIRIEESNLHWIYFVRCRITAVNYSVKSQYVQEDEHFFVPTTKSDVWKFPTFLQVSNLMEKYLDETQGTLYLRCEFAFSKEGDVFHVEDIDADPLKSRFPKLVKGELNVIQSMCKQVYDEGKFSDVVLESDGQTFKAHKDILSARSPVFRAMFETDMQESANGVVNINDYDPDTVELFLTFIYSNNLKDLEEKKAIKLYSVADKYGVLSLKWQCSNHLKSILSSSNVCDLLALADLHQDADLLDHVKHYIQLNSNLILNSQVWMDLMLSNASLASRVVHDLFTGNMGYL